MELGFKGRRAIVLGGTRGIGRAIAETLAAEGCSVAICARNEGQVVEAVRALESRGVKAFGEPVDVADGAAVTGFTGRAIRALGGLDIAISNASALVQGNTAEGWKQMLDIDILGLVSLVGASEGALEEAARKNGDASIVAISSVSAALATAPSAYGAIKGALIHLVKGYARGLAAKKIRANVVSPGSIYFKGGVWHQIEENRPDFFKHMLELNPFKRMGTPQEIADAAVFLASPRSSFTTGANLVVDGGITDRANY